MKHTAGIYHFTAYLTGPSEKRRFLSWKLRHAATCVCARLPWHAGFLREGLCTIAFETRVVGFVPRSRTINCCSSRGPRQGSQGRRQGATVTIPAVGFFTSFERFRQGRAIESLESLPKLLEGAPKRRHFTVGFEDLHSLSDIGFDAHGAD